MPTWTATLCDNDTSTPGILLNVVIVIVFLCFDYLTSTIGR